MTNEINNTEETATTEEKAGLNPTVKASLIGLGIGAAAVVLLRCLLNVPEEDETDEEDSTLSDEEAISQVEDFLANETPEDK